MRAGILICLGALLFCACAEQGEDALDSVEREAFQRLLLQHEQRFPKSRAEDYYKLISQSVFGIGHLIKGEASARTALEREIFTLGPPKAHEPLIEPLDPRGRMVRVNLRPFVAQNLSRDALLTVMMETAATVQADTALFLGRWNAFRELVKREEIDIPMEDFEAVDAFARDRDYPPLHHSDDYRGAYKPAYRVVLKDLFTRGVPGAYRTR